MIRLQRWESGPYFAAFSLHIPAMRVEIARICPRSPIVSLSNTYVRQALSVGSCSGRTFRRYACNVRLDSTPSHRSATGRRDLSRRRWTFHRVMAATQSPTSVSDARVPEPEVSHVDCAKSGVSSVPKHAAEPGAFWSPCTCAHAFARIAHDSNCPFLFTFGTVWLPDGVLVCGDAPRTAVGIAGMSHQAVSDFKDVSLFLIIFSVGLKPVFTRH
jgi:hypothetical protein